MNLDVRVRQAVAADVPAIARMKIAFAREEGYPETVHATEQEWLRDLFGPTGHFKAIIAERGDQIGGMLIYGEKYCPGWVQPIINILDIYVEPAHRRRHIATMLLQHIARHAITNNSTFMELNVSEDSVARLLYSRAGFQQVPQCLTYIVAHQGLRELATGKHASLP
jgi:ribosomal protein S18 acetylase RimI-like enzyme